MCGQTPEVRPVATNVKSTVKVGDRVKINGNYTGAKDIKGQIFSVTEVKDNGRDVRINAGKSLGYPLWSNEFDVVPAVTASAPVELPPAVGDKVVPNASYAVEPKARGQVGIITRVPNANSRLYLIQFASLNNQTYGLYRNEFGPEATAVQAPAPVTKVTTTPGISAPVTVKRAAPNVLGTTPYEKAVNIALGLGRTKGRVTSDEVQSELNLNGISSSQLGNAAGMIFRNKNWQRTNETVVSTRTASRGRRIAVWQYIGN